ncbi:MAG: outer membrane lipid asymmetry maintenance protein MlaD [Candidatus Puniceispirillales bacterium]|jgi:phospholipid/cholesterol/gamma-HCH transport system substrate-binding protein|tara:strand:+ start:227 stop:667 length:441 start_codon:yes stop_codon:yes gene_type:complete
MKENVLEILVGSVVLILSFVFVIFTLSNTGFQQKGKFINAEFGNVAGLKVGDDVLIAGIKVGEVSSNTLDSKSYLAVVKLNLQNNIFIPEDSVAKISSASLLGGQYVEIIPGASDEMLKDDETIYDTRDPVSLTDLLGQAVFSATD